MEGCRSASVRMVVRREYVFMWEGALWEGGIVASPSLRTFPPLRALLYGQDRIGGVLLARRFCRRYPQSSKNQAQNIITFTLSLDFDKHSFIQSIIGIEEHFSYQLNM